MTRRHGRSFERAESGFVDAPAREFRRADGTGAALLSAISALAFGAARAAAQVGGATGCVAQGFLFGAMIAGLGRERRPPAQDAAEEGL